MKIERIYVYDVGWVYMPETQLKELPNNCSARSIRGATYTMAVFDPQNNCIGWIFKDLLPA